MKIPVGIPVFVAAAGTDPRFAKMVSRWLVCAGLWLLVASVVGLLEAVRLIDVEILADHAFLTFGRLRPVHTMTMLFGWASMALIGLAFYVVAKSTLLPMHAPLSRTELFLANLALALTNVGIAVGAVAMCMGDVNAGREYREWPWYAMAPVFAAVGICGVLFYRMVARRAVAGIYISCWFVMSACFWIAIVVLMGYQTIWKAGIPDRIIDGFYIHNAVGMWFTPLAVGMTYYALPKLLNKPIYSYALGVLGFFTHMVFYTVIGTHHYIFTPLPMALQTTAVICSVAMIVPVWASTGNFLMTMKGERLAISHSYSLPFLFVGVVGYGLASLQGTAESLRFVQEILHFTHYTVGHAHFAMYVFVTFLIWGCIYGLVPRMTGREPPILVVAVHFWLALGGIAVYVIGLSVGGHLQGNAWVAGEPGMESVRVVAPYMVWRAVGGLLMFVAHIFFFVALWRMRPGAFTMAYSGGKS
ncbi:MAG: cbb3-type cytochrome c oxidase subunit I [Planctomycetota bacterium]|nr:cbb3-type cytochrome c oxidase subunit I [Planctomycetota bacterium]